MSKVITRLKAMMEIQRELNKKVHPEWEKQFYPYPDAMFTEATEAYNYLNWEWWKLLGRPIQWDQVKMEWVDVGHFLLSEMGQDPDIENTVLVESGFSTNIDKLLLTGKDFPDEAHRVVAVKDSIKGFIQEILRYDSGEDIRYAAQWFFVALVDMGLTIDQYYELYVGKVCLNELRWANGYKKGNYFGVGAYDPSHYVKVWDNGQEDNEWLSAKIETMDIDSPTFKQDLSQALKDQYSRVRNKLLDKSCSHGG